MRAFMWRDGELVAEEEHLLTMTALLPERARAMLERAGFVDVEVRGQYNDAEPTPDDDSSSTRQEGRAGDPRVGTARS